MPSCPSCALDAPDGLQFCPRCGASLVDPLIGAVLGDRYRVISRIGVGGMGVVYRAQHTTLKRDLAVKVLLPEFGGKEEFVRRFEREAESASRLAHPHIIAVTDFGRTPEGLLFLVMEYLDGRSLTSLIREGPLEVTRAVTIVRQMLAALTRAHAAGIVHRDLKPDNIMLIDREGQHDFVKILDFGIAKVTEPEPGREALTQAGVVFGTPEYLSPEQALGDKIDARADLYATGVILFEMLTGRRPFESEDKVRIISMHLSHPVPRLRDAYPAGEVPAALEDVVRQAMEKERENRFSSAAAFLTALEDAEQLAHQGAVADGRATPPPALGAPSSSPAVSPPASLASAAPARAKRRPVIAAAVVGLAIVATAVIVPLRSRPRTVATARVPRPTAPPSELAAQLHVVEGLLSAGENVKARVALEQLMAENPRNARVRYFLGRLAFADDRHGEAIGSYREAIGLDGSFRGDPVLLEHLGVALGETKVADQAL
ncbi:MAG TPA: protein kinase, partial [Polyangia bacterium]